MGLLDTHFDVPYLELACEALKSAIETSSPKYLVAFSSFALGCILFDSERFSEAAAAWRDCLAELENMPDAL